MIEINREYPICDTDIWVKNSKHKEYFFKDLLFDKYEKIYMSDAVRQEIGRERDDNKKKDFLLAHKHYQECYKDSCINMIRLNDGNIFDEELRMAIDRELDSYNIKYDYKEGRYKSMKSDLGETVTVVIASMLDIPIILCDEAKQDSIIKKYKYLDVRNMIDLLQHHYKDKDIEFIKKIRWQLSTPIDENREMFNNISKKEASKNKLKKFKQRYCYIAN